MQIIYEDKDILAINKPAGVVVHVDKHHESGTIVDEVLAKYPEMKSVGEDLTRPGIVHRLDKDTSGIILIAKNQSAFEFLKKQFQERKIEKFYRVLVVGEVKDRKGIIDLPIGRSFVNPTKRVARGKMRGKIREARTEYRVLNKFEGFTYLEASPKTGRTHQIRSHFAALDHPVVCDKLYAGKRFICPAGLGRHFLHAFSIEFCLPSEALAKEGRRIKLEAELPEDLRQVLQELGKGDKNS